MTMEKREESDSTRKERKGGMTSSPKKRRRSLQIKKRTLQNKMFKLRMS